MKHESFHIGVYWGERKESLDQCADRAAMFFSEMVCLDPLFSSWLIGASPGTASVQVAFPDRDGVLKLLEQGIHRTDTNKSPIPELGFGLTLWTGGPDSESAVVSIYCGSYSPYVGNVCGIVLPSDGEPARRLLTVDALTSLFQLMVECWEPDYGRVTSTKCREVLARSNDRIEAGWITYLSSKFDNVVPPSGVRVEQLNDDGRLFIVTEDRFNSDNVEHVERVRSVAASVNDQSPLDSKQSADE